MMKAWPVLLLLVVGAASNAQTLDEIAGEYAGASPSIHGNTWRRLSIRPDGTFHSEHYDGEVLSHVYDGTVKTADGRVILNWTFTADEARRLSELLDNFNVETFEEDFVPVRWGRRLYLVNAFRSSDFVRDVVRGYEPRRSERGFHLLRADDWKVRVSGRPDAPEEWKREFPPDNFETRIARQLAYHRAEIDAGSRQGLAPGMLLTLFSHKYGATDLRIISATEGTSVIENAYGDPPLTKGTRVVSRIR